MDYSIRKRVVIKTSCFTFDVMLVGTVINYWMSVLRDGTFRTLDMKCSQQSSWRLLLDGGSFMPLETNVVSAIVIELLAVTWCD
jgi:hypothetical protein